MLMQKWVLSFVLMASLIQGEEAADYVVIGLGTAGATMARMLTNDNSTSVIALHDGPNLQNDPDVMLTKNILFTVTSILFDSPLYEAGTSTNQPSANGRNLLWGIALPEGGASSVNAGAWCRNTPAINNDWEALAGPNWSNSQIETVYESLETYVGLTTNPSARGFNGPLNIRQNPSPTVLAQKFAQAIETVSGTGAVLDYNDPNTPIGVSTQVQYTQTGPDGSIRVSSATAFLGPDVVSPSGQGLNGRKLTIKFNTMAMRTIWQGNKAVGVQYFDNGKIKSVFANKGVIVCAGLRSSPFLLQSGVGSASQLQSLGIPSVYDNPNVGQGLTDQPHVVIAFLTNPNDTPDISCSSTIPNGVSVGNFDPSWPYSLPNISNTNLVNQYLGALFCPGFMFPANSTFAQISWLPDPATPLSTDRKIRISTVNPIPGLAVCIVDLVQPQSTGSVSVSSLNPFDPPVINVGEFTNSADLSLFVRAFQTYVLDLALNLSSTDPQYQIIFPDLDTLLDTEALTTFIRNEVGPNQHWQSHCRMAPLAQGGVVDSLGRVYGVQNLYVADNSVNPTGTDGSPMSTGYLVAANIAQLILQQQ